MGRKLIAGNWKMHGLGGSIAELDALISGLPGGVDVAVHPPLTLLAAFAARAGERIMIGAQDCDPGVFGARTGEVSATMLADAGARAVIVGHSERRAYHGETDVAVRTKAQAARAAGLLAIVCVGETEAERDAGAALAVIAGQLGGSLPQGEGPAFAVAYEPVWAIGSGRTPTLDQITQVHGAIRAQVGTGVRILYGGSVKAANAAAILRAPNVDGALVGGASLIARDFLPIVEAGAQAVR